MEQFINKILSFFKINGYKRYRPIKKPFIKLRVGDVIYKASNPKAFDIEVTRTYTIEEICRHRRYVTFFCSDDIYFNIYSDDFFKTCNEIELIATNFEEAEYLAQRYNADSFRCRNRKYVKRYTHIYIKHQ